MPIALAIGTGLDGSPYAMESLTYTWGGYGNPEERENTNASLTEIFTYDDLNRLTDPTVTNPAANCQSLSFACNLGYQS